MELFARSLPHPACPSMDVRHPVKACAKDCCSNSVEDSVSMVVASVSQEKVPVRRSNRYSLADVHPAVDENRRKHRSVVFDVVHPLYSLNDVDERKSYSLVDALAALVEA